jgi:hypothetical protein
MIVKDVKLPVDDVALPDFKITKAPHADHVVPMRKITEMQGFDKLSTKSQMEVLNYKPNFATLSEMTNTSKGTRAYNQWLRYEKGGIDVGPKFRSSMIERSAQLEVELQSRINSLLPGGKNP